MMAHIAGWLLFSRNWKVYWKRIKHSKWRVKEKLREDCLEAVALNDLWPMDFVHDQLAISKKLRILTIVDFRSRLFLATDPRFTCRGEDLVQTLEQVRTQIDCPKMSREDNGSEFISRDLDLWAYANDVTLKLSRPASRLIMESSKTQQQVSGGMVERPLVPKPRGRSQKSEDMAQRLFRTQTS